MANFQSSAVLLPLNETVGRGKKRKQPCKVSLPLSESDGSAGQSVAAFSIPEVIWGVSVCARARVHAPMCLHTVKSPHRPAHPQASDLHSCVL